MPIIARDPAQFRKRKALLTEPPNTLIRDIRDKEAALCRIKAPDFVTNDALAHAHRLYLGVEYKQYNDASTERLREYYQNLDKTLQNYQQNKRRRK